MVFQGTSFAPPKDTRERSEKASRQMHQIKRKIVQKRTRVSENDKKKQYMLSQSHPSVSFLIKAFDLNFDIKIMLLKASFQNIFYYRAI